MPRLPDVGDLGFPSISPATPGISVPANPIGPALEKLGNAAVVAGALQEREDLQQQKFSAQSALIGFQGGWAKQYSDLVDGMQPGAAGFADTVGKAYQDEADKFFATVPDALKPEIGAKLASLENVTLASARDAQAKEQFRYAKENTTNGLNTLGNLVQGAPDTATLSKNAASAQEQGEALIDANPNLTAPQKDAFKNTFRRNLANIAYAQYAELNPGAAKAALAVPSAIQSSAATGGLPALIQAIHGQESSGRANAPTSSTGAVGGFQIEPATFAQYAKPGEDIHNPQDNAAVGQRIIADLYQKYNGDAARVAVAYFSGPGNVAPEAFATPWKKDKSDGHTTTSAYVASVLHRLGQPAPAAGATGAVPTAAAVQPTGDSGPLAVAAAPASLSFDAVGQGASASTGVAADPVLGNLFQHLTPDDREKLTGMIDKNQAQVATARAQGYERQIIDASAGLAPMPLRQDIENDPMLDNGRRNALLKSYDAADKTQIQTRAALAKFADPNAAFNPFDDGDQKAAQLVYSGLGGNLPALQAVVSRTGIVPKAAGTALRGAFVSADPNVASQGMQIAFNLMQRNPNIFAGLDGAADIEKTATTFRHYVDDLGYSADDAAKQVQAMQAPDYQAKVKANIKGADLNKIVTDNLSASDLTSAFNTGLPIFGRPAAGNPQAQSLMMQDYAELFRTAYGQTGDIGAAKQLAIQQLKKVWGVTSVNGTPTITRYPPENAPVYAGIADVSGKIADQAIEAIREFQSAAPERLGAAADEGAAAVTGGFGPRKTVETPPPAGSEAALLGIPNTAVAPGPAAPAITGNAPAPDITGRTAKVDPSHLMLTPLMNGVTAREYEAGRVPQYQVSWTDDHGILHTLPQPFAADPRRMVTEQSSAREAAFRAAKAQNEASVAEAKRIATQPKTFQALGGDMSAVPRTTTPLLRAGL